MPAETLTKKDPTVRGYVDLRGRTITTAIAWAVHGQLAELRLGDELEVITDAFPAIEPDLEAWCRTTGHELLDAVRHADGRRLRVRKGAPRRNDHRVAVVLSEDGLEELLSPLGFALAAALGGAQVALYPQGPAVHQRRGSIAPAGSPSWSTFPSSSSS